MKIFHLGTSSDLWKSFTVSYFSGIWKHISVPCVFIYVQILNMYISTICTMYNVHTALHQLHKYLSLYRDNILALLYLPHTFFISLSDKTAAQLYEFMSLLSDIFIHNRHVALYNLDNYSLHNWSQVKGSRCFIQGCIPLAVWYIYDITIISIHHV